jgi:hypothetical protein
LADADAAAVCATIVGVTVVEGIVYTLKVAIGGALESEEATALDELAHLAVAIAGAVARAVVAGPGAVCAAGRTFEAKGIAEETGLVLDVAAGAFANRHLAKTLALGIAGLDFKGLHAVGVRGIAKGAAVSALFVGAGVKANRHLGATLALGVASLDLLGFKTLGIVGIADCAGVSAHLLPAGVVAVLAENAKDFAQKA